VRKGEWGQGGKITNGTRLKEPSLKKGNNDNVHAERGQGEVSRDELGRKERAGERTNETS